MLNREPLRSAAFHEVLRRINPSLLVLVSEPSPVQTDWEGEIHSFFLFGVLLINRIVQFDFFLGIEQQYFKLNSTRVYVRAFQPDAVAPRCFLNTEKFSG